MIIKSLALNAFRNIDNINIEFDKGLNIIYGDNAQGKTNILESIYVAGTTRSHKGSKDKEMIKIGEDEAHIRVILEKDELDRKILKSIVSVYNGGPVGIETLSLLLGEDRRTVEEVYEPYLVKIGFIKRTPRGRVVTELGYNHLGLEKILE